MGYCELFDNTEIECLGFLEKFLQPFASQNLKHPKFGLNFDLIIKSCRLRTFI
jgi:hypothetical protein